MLRIISNLVKTRHRLTLGPRQVKLLVLVALTLCLRLDVAQSFQSTSCLSVAFASLPAAVTLILVPTKTCPAVLPAEMAKAWRKPLASAARLLARPSATAVPVAVLA